MGKYINITVLILIFTANCYGQTKENFSNDLIGSWQGKGQLFGSEAIFNMTWEKVLNNKFLKLEFKNQFKDKAGNEYTMNANGYYDFEENKGYWFDSRGMVLQLKLEIKDSTLIVLWGRKEDEQGKTIYTLNGDELNVRDSILKENQYLPFGNASYKKME